MSIEPDHAISSFRRPIQPPDRISDLPDSILTHILYFLPPKHAATTTILSKRWKPLWFSLPTIDFDEETFKDFDSFRQTLYSKTFSLQDNTLPIHSFRIKCEKFSQFDQNDFDQFFHFVMRKNIKYLAFHMFEKKNSFSYTTLKKVYPIKLPCCVLSFKALEILKLENIDIGDYDQVDLDFPCVKILHLSNVSFNCSESVVKFILGFPFVEDLVTEVSLHQPMKTVENSIALPNLVNVRICDSYTPLSLVSNSKKLSVKGTLWIIEATEFPMFHKLTHLELGYYSTRLCMRECTWMLEILPYFPKLQHLIIQDRVDAMNSTNRWKIPSISIVPECLLSELKTCCIRGYKGKQCQFEFAKYIMQHSQVLETITIECTCVQKYQMFVKLSSCKRVSRSCKLLIR